MKLNLQRVIFEFQEMAFSYAFGKNGGRIDGRCRAVRRHHTAFRRVGKAQKGKVEGTRRPAFRKGTKREPRCPECKVRLMRDGKKARRGWFPQRNREGALPFRRLGQVRRRRRGMREEDETDEQLLLVPQALLRIAQGHQVLQAGSIRELLPLPLEPRQEARAEGHDRFPLQQGLRDAEKRNVQNVGFACVNERRLFFRNFKRNDNVVFDSVGMYAIIYFCKFSLNRPPDLLLFVGF